MQLVLICASLVLSWLGLQIVHELGHVLVAWATGGQVNQVVLHPLAISRTDVSPNPQPLVERWAGPVVGVLLPLVFLAIAGPSGRTTRDLFRFFAGACLIANGLYLGIGSFGRVGDAGDLLRRGAPIWTLWLFGLVAVPAGLLLWNGTGATFGFGVAHWRGVVACNHRAHRSAGRHHRARVSAQPILRLFFYDHHQRVTRDHRRDRVEATEPHLCERHHANRPRFPPGDVCGRWT